VPLIDYNILCFSTNPIFLSSWTALITGAKCDDHAIVFVGPSEKNSPEYCARGRVTGLPTGQTADKAENAAGWDPARLLPCHHATLSRMDWDLGFMRWQGCGRQVGTAKLCVRALSFSISSSVRFGPTYSQLQHHSDSLPTCYRLRDKSAHQLWKPVWKFTYWLDAEPDKCKLH